MTKFDELEHQYFLDIFKKHFDYGKHHTVSTGGILNMLKAYKVVPSYQGYQLLVGGCIIDKGEPLFFLKINEVRDESFPPGQAKKWKKYIGKNMVSIRGMLELKDKKVLFFRKQVKHLRLIVTTPKGLFSAEEYAKLQKVVADHIFGIDAETGMKVEVDYIHD